MSYKNYSSLFYWGPISGSFFGPHILWGAQRFSNIFFVRLANLGLFQTAAQGETVPGSRLLRQALRLFHRGAPGPA